MTTYVLRRFLIGVPLVFFMSFVVFLIMGASGNTGFTKFAADPSVDRQTLNREKRDLGLNRPLVTRYLYWLRGVCFDVRLTPERRYLADFDLKEEGFAQNLGIEAAPVWERVIRGPSSSVIPAEPTPFPGVDAQALRDIFDPERYASVRLGFSGHAGTTVHVHLASERPEDPSETPRREAVFETTLPADGLPEGVGGTIEIPFEEAAERGVSIAHLVSLSISAGDTLENMGFEGRLRSFSRMDEDKTLEDAALRLQFTGRPEERVLLNRLDRPFFNQKIEAGEWEVDWDAFDRDRAADAAPAGSPEQERHLARLRKRDRISYDTFEMDARLEGDTPRTLRVEFLSRPDGAARDAEPAIAGIDLDIPPGASRQEIPLALLRERGVNLRAVAGIAFRCDASATFTVDDLRLRVSGNPVRLGLPNFGQSYDKKMDVWSYLLGKIGNTIQLNLAALTLVWLLALPAGIYAATRAYGAGDRVLTVVMYAGQAVPSFFLATLALTGIQALNVSLEPDGPLAWLRLPIQGRTSVEYATFGFWARVWDVARHSVGPVAVMAFGGLAGLQRVMRAQMMEEKTKLYILAARAKGLPERTLVYKHALRNAILPFIASLGSILPAMIGGSAFIEIIFSYPGMGQAMLEAIQNYDTNVVMASMFASGMLLVFGNLLADILLSIADPRISLEGRGA